MEVRRRAESLPENVPLEILHLLPHDDDLIELWCRSRRRPKGGAVQWRMRARCYGTCHLRPNAVVLERSSFDDADANAQRIAALHAVATAVRGDADAGAVPSVKDADFQSGVKRVRIDESGAERPEGLAPEPEPPKVERITVATGNQMVDQFQP